MNCPSRLNPPMPYVPHKRAGLWGGGDGAIAKESDAQAGETELDPGTQV